ncbi:MAG: family 78 glycoside hydrolase catalytic domain [Saprospiraceae bacterium]
MYKLHISILLSFIFTLALTTGVAASVTIENLKVEAQEKPLGIDISNPQFSWQMKASDAKRGYFQKAYQIVVKDANKQIVWDAGKVNSALSHAIEYAGSPLKATTRYTWELTVWDNSDAKITSTSWFETGLMNPDISAWSGAKWIGGGAEDLVLYSHYLSVFKWQYTLQLDEASKSTKAAFVFGGNDARLMKKDLNLMAMHNAVNESYIAFELDISKVSDAVDGLAKLNIYRVGYTKNDSKDIPFKTLDIPQSVINQANKYQKHTVFAACNFGLFEIAINGEANVLKEKIVENASPFGPRGINLNPVGSGNNFISFPMLADIGFQTNENQIAHFSEVVIKNFRLPSNTLFAENLNNQSYTGIFKSSKLSVKAGNYTVAGGALILANPSKNAAPMLRTTFKTPAKDIKSARLYVTARGIYEMYLNGQRVSNDYFNPGLTQYNKTHMYQTYDLTDALKKGAENALGAWLSEGWWSGNITFSGDSWNYFGDRQSLLCKLVITYADDTKQTITSNPNEWRFFNDGPVRYGSYFQGEVYDANKEALIKDWSTATYQDATWKPAVEVPLEGTTYQATTTDFSGRRSTLDYKAFKLIGQIGNNATVVKTMTAQSVEEVRPQVFVYDMAQNMVGVPQILVKNGKKGQVITLRYAEVKYPALSEYGENVGMVMMENIRAALTQDIYILKGGDETIQPRFTFHGYRYLEITGIEEAIPINDVKGLVISSVLGLASSYETSNELVNKLWENITWSLRSNFLSIPTDTPARNERMGWSGDISVFSRSATYLTDAHLFLRRHLLGMRDVQAENGRFTDVAPMGGGFGGTLWGSAGIVVAWETYQQYGDVQLLREHYDAMKRYLAFLDTKVDPSNGILNEGPLGDWLSPEGNKNDNTLFWMSYYAYDLELVSQVANILGKTDDTVKFKIRQAEIKKAFNDIYVDKTSHRTIKSGVKAARMGPPNARAVEEKSDKGTLIDTQASYAIPLDLGTFNEENKPYAIKYLKEAVARKNVDDEGAEHPAYSLMTGFIGTASISKALSENADHAEAYRLLQQTSYPSWLYSVVNGATSIWERLNSYTVENGFGGNNSMNSFNHYSFGAVSAWMYNYSLGIQRSPEKAAFQHIILKPTPDPDKVMTFAKGHYDSVYGTIKSEWRYQGDQLIYLVTIPANTSATLYLPTNNVKKAKESGKKLKPRNGISQLSMEDDQVKMNISSGEYRFEIK